MSTEPAALEGDRVLDVLAACDEALAAGQSPPSRGPDVDISEMRRVDRGLACIKLLREVLGSEPIEAREAMPDLERAIGPFGVLPFRQLGRYEVRRTLGEGSCGIVFLAFDPQLRRETALKVPRGAGAL